MKSKELIKIIAAIILLIMFIILLAISYFTWVDIESKATREIKETCNLEIKQYKGRNIFVITPKEGATSNIKMLYFHGGAYVAEASKYHWDFIEKLIKDTGITVIMPDYPLTPKYNYKDVFEIVIPLYKEIIQRVNTEELILAGDSAGGGISLALLERAKEENLKMPKKTLLISPWLDVRLKNEKIEQVEKFDKELNKESLILAGISYASEDGMNSYLVNPIYGDLKGLENIAIFTGTYDILNPDVHTLDEKAKSVGTQITIKEYDRAGHIWIIKPNTEQEIIDQGYQDFVKEIIDAEK